MDLNNRNERLWGIDVLKILSVIMILLLHLLGQGGVIEYTSSYSKLIFKALQMFSLCAVNILCICTGFLMVKKKYNFNRIIKTLTVVIVVNILILIVYLIVGGAILSGLNYMRLSLSTTYWYVVDYIVIILLMPYLNKMIFCLNKDDFKRLIITLIVVATILPFFFGTDVVGFNGGYSLSWMIVLYLVGAYEKLYGAFIKSKQFYIVISFGAYAMMMAVQFELRTLNLDSLNTFIDYTMSYTSPFVFIMALFLFKAICTIHINKRLQSLVKWLSEASLMAYIVHCNGIIYSVILNDLLKNVCDEGILNIVTVLVIVIVGYYFIAAISNSLWNHFFDGVISKRRYKVNM